MENEPHNMEFYEDLCNLARVLPNLEPATVYNELNILRDNPERVHIILKKYFSSYQPEEHNCMSDDIKNIKRVVPTIPVININKELWSVEHKENRVQIVLKNYMTNQINSKHSLPLDPIDSISCPDKKVKLDETLKNEQDDDQESTENYTFSVDDTAEYLFVNELHETTQNNTENIEEEINYNNDLLIYDILPKSTIQSTLSELFPQYSVDVLNKVCKDLNIDINDSSDESKIDLAIDALINYNSEETTPHKDEIEIVNIDLSTSDDTIQNSSTLDTDSTDVEITDCYQDFDSEQEILFENYRKSIEKFSSWYSTILYKDAVADSDNLEGLPKKKNF